MRLAFTPKAWEDYTFWLSADRTVVKRISRLIDDAVRDPFVYSDRSRLGPMTHQPRTAS